MLGFRLVLTLQDLSEVYMREHKSRPQVGFDPPMAEGIYLNLTLTNDHGHHGWIEVLIVT